MLIAIANQKGGVGKTTSTICLGGVLSKSSSCLLIDLDPQGNLSTGLGETLADGQLSSYEVITEQAEALDAIVTTKSGLSLLPADITLAKAEPEMLTKVGNFFLLRERLEKVTARFEHILIDCPPSLGLLTVNALATADAVLIPVQCQFFALKGLSALQETIQSVQKRLHPELKILGVLPTMAEMNTLMTQDVLASLKNRFQDIPVFDPVPKSIRFAESNVAGESIHQYSSEQKLIKPYEAIARMMTGGKP
uniref:Cobyrinic acid ac-diamide synthase n=1 Tax=Cyanothece sp. (strain PCC 7425 / ATCC 29141) TaxID=395961 RepID=B8HZ87_CYAP4